MIAPSTQQMNAVDAAFEAAHDVYGVTSEEISNGFNRKPKVVLARRAVVVGLRLDAGLQWRHIARLVMAENDSEMIEIGYRLAMTESNASERKRINELRRKLSKRLDG